MSVQHDVKRAVIECSTSGANTIVAAVAGKRIAVLGYTIVAAGAVTVRWTSDTTAISGPMSFAANGGVSPATVDADKAHMVTAVGEALKITLGGAVAIAGHLVYAEV